MQLALVTSSEQGVALDNPQKCIPASVGLWEYVVLWAMEEANSQARVNSTDEHLRFFFLFLKGKKKKKGKENKFP